MKRKQSSLENSSPTHEENNERADQDDESSQSKRRRTNTSKDLQIISKNSDSNTSSEKSLIKSGIKRTSTLLTSPIVALEGHQGEIYCSQFDGKHGKYLASAGFDKTILLWDMMDECSNQYTLKGHSNAILQLAWSNDGEKLYSASADKSIMVWDIEHVHRLRKFREHSQVVNSVATSVSDLFVSGSDDRTAKIYDLRDDDESIISINCKYPVLSVAIHSSNYQVFTAGIDNVIKVWDTRIVKDDVTEPLYTLQGHQDTITDIKLSPDGNQLLSTAMDQSVFLWDVRPFSNQQSRWLRCYSGAKHGMDRNLLRCNWSHDGSKVSCGSADTFVYVWNAQNCQILYKLPGHKGTVNEVTFHPTEPILASCSNDKTIYLGEIEP